MKVSEKEKTEALEAARQVIALYDAGQVPESERDAVVCAVTLVDTIDELLALRKVADAAKDFRFDHRDIDLALLDAGM